MGLIRTILALVILLILVHVGLMYFAIGRGTNVLTNAVYSLGVLAPLWGFLYYGYKNHVYFADVFLSVRRGAMVEKVTVREHREKEWHVWARRRCNDRV